MKNRYLYIVVALVLSCSNTSKMNESGWSIIRANGLNGENKVFNFLFFQNKMNGIMLGYKYTDEDLLSKKFDNFNATLYCTHDGGNNWVEKGLGRGQFSSYAAKDSFIFISKTITSLDNNKSMNDFSEVYLSKNMGRSWIEYSSFEKFYVRNMFAYSKNEIYILGKHNNESFWTLEKTIDNGLNWNKVGELNNDLDYPTLFNDYLFYLSNSSESLLMQKSLISGESKSIKLPNSNFKPYFINVFNNKLYITGVVEKQIYIYEYILKNDQYEYVTSIDEENKFPAYFYYVNNKLVLFLGERNTIGVTYSIYSKNRSSDIWDKDPIPSSYFKPYTFFENEIWGYSYESKFYRKVLD